MLLMMMSTAFFKILFSQKREKQNPIHSRNAQMKKTRSSPSVFAVVAPSTSIIFFVLKERDAKYGGHYV